ncbi:MAG: MFS transporter [Oscillospiraceae bacterium]|nr:MFS transporter [Oscillospiraceae bacterium]
MPKLLFAKLTEEKRAAVLFFFICWLFYMSTGIYWPYMSAHYANLGIDPGLIGILMSIGSIATIFILPLWSRLSDRTGNRRGVLKIICIGASLSVLLFLVSKSFWPLFFTIFCLSAFGMSFAPLSDAVSISYLSGTSIRFSQVRIGGTIGFSVVLLFSGYIYAYNPALTFICASFSFFLLFLCVRKIPQVEIAKKEKRRLELKRLFKNRRIVFILFIAFCIQITLSFYFSFIGVYIQELGYSSREIAMSSFVSALSEIPVLLLIDRALRRFPVTGVSLFCGFIMTVRLLMLAMAQGIGMVYLTQVGNGLSFMALYYCCATFINKEMEEDMKSTGQGLLAFVQMGLGTSIGNILGGYISQFAGMRYAYLYYGLGLGCICTACTLVFIALRIIKKAKRGNTTNA